MNEERINEGLTKEKELVSRIEVLKERIKDEPDGYFKELDKEELKYSEGLLEFIRKRIILLKPYLGGVTFKDMSMVGFLEDTEGHGFYFEDKDGNKVVLRSFQDPYCEGLSYLNLSVLKESDFDGLLFDFDGNDLSKSVEVVKDQGIRLNPNNGHPIFVPWKVHNKYWNDDDMSLVLARITDETDGSFDFKTWRVSGLIGSMWLIKHYGSENE